MLGAVGGKMQERGGMIYKLRMPASLSPVSSLTKDISIPRESIWWAIGAQRLLERDLFILQGHFLPTKS